MAKVEAAVKAHVLIVDDEPEHARIMADALKKPGHSCTVVHSAAAAGEELSGGVFDVIVTDLVMERPDAGLAVLAQAKRDQPGSETILVTAHGDVPTAKAALQGGAYDFIEKPLDLVVFRNLVQRAAETVALRQQNKSLRTQLDAAYAVDGIVGESPAIQQVLKTIHQVAGSNIPVLITGESGTGKELVAAAIHRHSRRAEKRYVTFNAAGQAESLLEDQLFGHVRGAFTGAERDREGVFEYADKGTVFLDEIGDMPVAMQPKLLRVLESGDVVRLGSNDLRRVDVRFVSATNRDLRDSISAGKFREDLYFRLKGVEIRLPSLRERRDDIPLLVHHAIGKFCKELGRPAMQVTQSALMRLCSYDWPGNVRELMMVVHRMVVTAAGHELDLGDVPTEVRASDAAEDAADAIGRTEHGSATPAPNTADAPTLVGMDMAQLEKEAIRQTLARTNGNREQAAQLLGIGERTLYRKIKDYGLR